MRRQCYVLSKNTLHSPPHPRPGICILGCPQVHAERHHGLVLLLLWRRVLRGLRTVGVGVPEGHRVDEQPHRLR